MQVFKSVRTLALTTLHSSNPLLQKSQVIEIVGDFAFEYGFFAGHEDFRLCTDPTADIYVTYAHRSIEEFFGSFGFLQALDDGKSVDELLGSDCEKPIFMTNPLVLKFCLWLLSRQDLGFKHRDDCFEKLVTYVVNCINHEQFNPEVIVRIFPAINIDLMESVKDSQELSFFRHILRKSQHINKLHVKKNVYAYNDKFDGIIHQTDWIFDCLTNEVLDKLTLVSIGNYLTCQDCHKNDTLTISLNMDGYMDGTRYLDILLNKYKLCKRNPQVYLRTKISRDYDICTAISEHMKELHLWGDRDSTLFASGDIPYCPLFTCLNVGNLHINPSVPSAFTKAVNDGKLPILRCTKLDSVYMNITDWPEVSDFRYQTDNLTLSLPDRNDVQNLLSKLTCLTLENPVGTDKRLVNVDRVFTQPLTKLSVLKLVDIDIHCFSKLTAVLKQDKLPNLSELFLSGYEYFYENPAFD